MQKGNDAIGLMALTPMLVESMRPISVPVEPMFPVTMVALAPLRVFIEAGMDNRPSDVYDSL